MIMPDGAIGGFYTLSSAALRLQELPEGSPSGCRATRCLPATFIGRQAIDRQYPVKGGEFPVARCAVFARELLAAAGAVMIAVRASILTHFLSQSRHPGENPGKVG
jgi:hypothetical protein